MALTLQILHASDFEAGIPALDDAVRFSAVINRLRTDPELPTNVIANTLTLSSGDNYIPGAFLNASSDLSLNGVGGLGTATPLNVVIGRGDIGILNALGIQASALGNHEFDLGVRQVRDILRNGGGNPGTNFPYLSTNLNFQPEIAAGNISSTDLASNQFTAEASTIVRQIARSTVITLPGADGIAGNADDERIGIVGATTPTLPNISSSGSIGVTPTNPTDFTALAAEIQSTVDILKDTGINKIVLLSHFQQFGIERDEIAPRLQDVDIIIAGGSNTLLSDVNDPLRSGDTSAGNYPVIRTDATGQPILVVNTDGNYKYVGRLVVDFDDNGVIIPDSLNNVINGAYATDEAGVDRVYGSDVDPRTVANPNVVAITDGIRQVISSRDNNIFGRTTVFLNGTRNDVRTQETNFGNLTADANLALGQSFDPTVLVSIKNGGGIRDNIGVISESAGGVSAEDFQRLPPQPNPLAPNKQIGDISQLDIENSLRFNNGLTLLTVTAEELKLILEHAVAGTTPGATPGQFPQVSGVSFSFDPTGTAIAFDNDGNTSTPGSRIRSVAIVDQNNGILDEVFRDGQFVGDLNRQIRLITLDFLANPSSATPGLGGDRYPFPAFGENRVDLVQSGNLTGAATFANDGSEQDALAEYLSGNFIDTPYSIEDVGPSLDLRIQNVAQRRDVELGELIDLRNSPAVQASFVVNSEAAFKNNVGFYQVDDETGRIGNLRPGDAGYAQAAIQHNVFNLGSNGSSSVNLVGGLYAPFIVANGTPADFLANPINQPNGSVQAYFAFLGANPDGVDHIRLLGDKTFGFEDMFGGGDFDYNDVVLQVSIA